MEEAMNFDLDHFRQDLYIRIKDLVYKNNHGAHADEVNEEAALDLFNWTYDVCYVSAVNKPLEDLFDLYVEKGILVTLNILQVIRSCCREDITKMKVILQLIVDNLVECGFNYNQANEFVTEYYPGKNAC